MYEVKFADIGEGIHEGVLYKWEVAVGDNIKDGETLFQVETDKVNAEIPSPVDGVITKINAAVGDTIHVGETIVEIDDGSSSEVENTKPVTESVEEKGSTSVVGEIEVSSELIPSSSEMLMDKETVTTKRKVLATPVARKMSKDLGVDINVVTGSGPAGRVMKEDIKNYHEANMSSSKSVKAKGSNVVSNTVSSHQADKVYNDFDKELDGYDYERIPMTMLRKTVAKNMTRSKFTIPHTSAMDEFDVTELVNFRTGQKEKLKAKGIKLTYLPIIIKAVAVALKKYPVMNSSLDESSDEIIQKNFYNIGIAVDTKDGLMVPVIKGADKSGVIDIADRLETLIESCRNKTVKLDDLSNGTFTITNYGAIGSTYGVPVIKFPEAAIIGIGKIKKSPEVIDGEIVIRDIMPVSLSFDHRIIDGADAGRFLNEVKELLADPVLLLMR